MKIVMPFTQIDKEIAALQERMKELLAESDALQKQIDGLRVERKRIEDKEKTVIRGADVVSRVTFHGTAGSSR